MRRYAEGTAVPIAKSRAEIDKLLRTWGADAVQWTDDFKSGRVILRFVWSHGQVRLHARLQVAIPTDAVLRDRAMGARGFSDARYAKLREGAGREEHRILLLWLKAAFNAVEAGLVDASTLFLPFLEGNDGETVAEKALPKLHLLLGAGADRLLPAEVQLR